MDNKETFGVELELVTKKFSQKMEEMKSKISNFGKTAKENFQTGLYMDTSEARKRLSELQKLVQTTGVKQQIRDIQNDLDTLDTSKVAKIGQIFNKIKAPIETLKNKIKDNKKELDKFSSATNKSFNKGIKSIKRFALSLFGIQSIWRAVSRASSAYLSQDTELSNKLQAVWVGLGALFSSVLETMASGLLKMVTYINAFVKGLTGVDYLAKAMDKANKKTKDTSKSVKDLKGQLAGFDEINNIADSGNDGSVENADTSWVNAFESVKPDTAWTEKIQNFGAWVRDNWELVAVGIVGIASVIGALGLASTLATPGLTGILVPLLAIALGVTGLIALVLGICELFKEGGNETKAWTLILGGLLAIVLAVGLAFGAIPMLITALVAAVTAGVLWIIKHWDEVKSAISAGITAIGNWFKGLWQGIKDKCGVLGDIISQPFKIAISTIKNVWNGAKTFFNGIKDFFVGIFTLDGEKTKTGLRNVLSGMGNIIIAFIEGILNSFLIPINSAIKLINKIPGVDIPTLKITIPKIPKLDTGTNYVPNDQLAYIHKGEAVVPKKFNSDKYFNRENDETNDLLRELIDVIDSKEYTTYLDGKVIGKTAKEYINSQSRIMGRSVV